MVCCVSAFSFIVVEIYWHSYGRHFATNTQAWSISSEHSDHRNSTAVESVSKNMLILRFSRDINNCEKKKIEFIYISTYLIHSSSVGAVTRELVANTENRGSGDGGCLERYFLPAACATANRSPILRCH